MQVVLTIVGKDKVGITAKVTNALANMNINIININPKGKIIKKKWKIKKQLLI